MSNKPASVGFIELHALAEPPSAREADVLESQLTRVAATLRSGFAGQGSLFEVEAQAFASTLDRLAGEPKA
jgi:hypothetical protein